MIVRLLNRHRNGSVLAMPKRFISLFMALAMLICGTIVPATAEAMEVSGAHVGEWFEVSGHGLLDEGHGNSDTQDAPCHALTHHHCAAALRVDAAHLSANAIQASRTGWPPYITPMKSRSVAPPIQPPSA